MSSRHRNQSVSRKFFEVHAFDGATWRIGADVPTLPDAAAAAERIIAERQAVGVRIVRCRDAYGFVTRTTMFKTPMTVAGSIESVSPVADPHAQVCQVYADLRTDGARETIANVLDRYLRQARISPIELVYSYENAFQLHDTGTSLQGALQKVAIAQTQGTRLPAVARLKELMALVDGAIAELRRLRDQESGVPLTPEGYRDAVRRSPDAALRQLANHLVPLKTWRAKLLALVSLITFEDGPETVIPVDMMIADLMGFTTVFDEWSRGDERVAQILLMIAAHGGGLPAPADDPTADFSHFNRLMAADHLIRTRSALQRRILRELLPPATLVDDRSLPRQADAWTRLHNAIRGSQHLAADVELTEVIEARCLRAINPENIDLFLSRIPTLAEKLAKLLELAAQVPITAVKIALLEFFRARLSLDMLAKEYPTGRATLVAVLAGLSHGVDALDLEIQQKTATLEMIDGMLLDVLRNDVFSVPARTLPERVLWLLKTCAGAPMPPGRARQHATEIVHRTLRNKDVLTSMLRRHQTNAERMQALAALNDLVVSAGLGGEQR